MKIEKYKKLKSNKYEVEIDDIKVKLFDDVIVKYELLRKKELSYEEFEEITEYNDKLEAYYKSLRYITRRLRTEKEIWKYLEKDYSKEVIKETINRLKNDGYLNKEIFLKSYLNDQINFGISLLKFSILTSGKLLIICSSGFNFLLSLYSESPIPLDIFKFPKILPSDTHPSAFSILFNSAGIDGL